MKITRVEAIHLANVPTEPPPMRPLPNSANLTIVEVETDEGIIGYGRTGGSVELINGRLADFLAGEDPMLTDQIWHQLTQTFGGATAALAGIDLALWDIKGKALGVPVWRLLGGAQERVRAYVSFGLGGPNTSMSMVPAYTTEELVEEAMLLVKGSHTKLKTGVGRYEVPNPDADAERMMALREVLGPEVMLMMDAGKNMSFHDALRLCKLCEPYHIEFFEEPVIGNDARQLANLRAQTTIPMAANPSGMRDVYREFLANEIVDFVQPNVAQIGITESKAIADMALAFNRPISNGNGSGPHNMHLQAGMPNGWGVEFHYRHWMEYRTVYQNLPEPADGWLTLPETPGLALDPKPEVVEQFRV
ncbi:MAG: mandelate racemase/muconate lactonizing protein [Gemmatimonadetes bacterium]|nr:mandelate racemase/muconate lactonizing protein [Gemmatimonadota bacterium]